MIKIISSFSLYSFFTLAVAILQCTNITHAAGDESILNADETSRLIQQHFARRDWAALDQMGSQLVRAYEKDPNKFAALRTFFYVLPNDKSPAGTLDSYNAWVVRSPDSYAAVYARARYYAFTAMAARGGEFSKDVRPEQFKKMEEYFVLSRKDLVRSLKLSTRPTMSYFQLMRIARYSGTAKEVWQYYEKSTLVDPDNLTLAEQYLQSLQPRWGGDYESLQRFPDEARRRGLSATKTVTLRFKARWLAAQDYVLYEEKKRAQQLLTTIANDPADAEHNSSAIIELADLAEADRNYETASNYYLQGLKRKPNDVRLLVGLAATMRDLNRPQEALALYDRAIAVAPDDIYALSGRGWLNHQILKNDKAALPDVLKAAQLGESTSQSIMGYYSWEGKVVRLNQVEALYWWSQSAKQNNKVAQDSLTFAKKKLGSHYDEMLTAANRMKRLKPLE